MVGWPGGVVPGATGGSGVLNGRRKQAARRPLSAPGARGPSARRPGRGAVVSGGSPGSGRRMARRSERRSGRRSGKKRWPRRGRARPGPASALPSRWAAARSRDARQGAPGVVPALPSTPGTRARKVSTFRIPFLSTFRVPLTTRKRGGPGRRGAGSARRGREGEGGRRWARRGPGRGTIPGAGRGSRAGRGAGSGGGGRAAARGAAGGYPSSDLLRVGCNAGGNLW